MAEQVRREDVDPGQYPDAWEYDIIDEDAETRIQPKEGFSLGANPFYFGNGWRIRPDGVNLIIEFDNSGTWTEQARFEA